MLLYLVWTKGEDPAAEICLDLVRAATAMVDQVVSETREFHQPPESIGTELMRHIHSLSWENDVLQQDLITWQDAKKKGTKRIRDCGAEGFKKAIAGLEVMGLGERLQAGSVPAFRALKPWP